MSRARAAYLGAIVVLVLVLGGLVYTMLTLARPVASQPAEVSPGLTHVLSIYSTGPTAEEQLVGPYGVAFGGGRLYASDSGRGVVHVFDEGGRYLRSVGEKGPAPGQLMQPLGVAADPGGRLYVADRGRSAVVVYEADGSLADEIALELPLTPFVSGELLYVTTASGVTLFDRGSLRRAASWGTRGRGDDQFDFPNGIAKDGAGAVYVSDGNNLRVKAVDADGRSLWVVGRPPADMGDTEGRVFGLAGGMALVDRTLYVVDPLSGVIHLVSTEGEYLGHVGEMGSTEGAFGYPSQIVSMGGGRFAVSEWGNARVQIVDIDRDAVVAAGDGRR